MTHKRLAYEVKYDKMNWTDKIKRILNYDKKLSMSILTFYLSHIYDTSHNYGIQIHNYESQNK